MINIQVEVVGKQIKASIFGFDLTVTGNSLNEAFEMIEQRLSDMAFDGKFKKETVEACFGYEDGDTRDWKEAVEHERRENHLKTLFQKHFPEAFFADGDWSAINNIFLFAPMHHCDDNETLDYLQNKAYKFLEKDGPESPHWVLFVDEVANELRRDKWEKYKVLPDGYREILKNSQEIKDGCGHWQKIAYLKELYELHY
jgi:hypothetical protein